LINAVHFPSLKDHASAIASHPAFQLAFQAIVEVIKIFTATIFLKLLTDQLFKGISQNSIVGLPISHITTYAPLIEEVEFRGACFLGLRCVSEAMRKTPEEERPFLKILPVHLSSIAFAAAHLANPIPNCYKVLQFAITYFLAVRWAYLVDKYHTLSIGILSHGIHNTCVMGTLFYPSFSPFFIAMILVNGIGIGLLGQTNNP